MYKIEYNLPKLTIDEAATKAIACLQEVEQLGGDSLYYCIQASNILAIAGLRSLSPYNEFDNNFSEEKISNLNEILRKYGCEAVEQIEYGPTPESKNFAVINFDTLKNIGTIYPFMKDMHLQPPSKAPWSEYRLWEMRNWTYLAGLMEDEVIPKKWLQSWWNPQHIHFGMMLGNPGIALSSSAERGIGELDRNTDMDMIDISVGISKDFDNVSLNYAVPKDKLNDSEVTSHAGLWQGTLQKVYEEYTDDKLSSIAGYSEELAKKKEAK